MIVRKSEAQHFKSRLNWMLTGDILRQVRQLTWVREDFDDLQAVNAKAEKFERQKDVRYLVLFPFDCDWSKQLWLASSK